MTKKEQFIQAIQEADISKDDWWWEAFEALGNCYAHGYLQASLDDLGEVMSLNEEEVREELIEGAENLSDNRF